MYIQAYIEDYYNTQYKLEYTFDTLFKIFTILAIVIACLGLFGLTSFELIQRTKEIGIRKVLGAKVLSIFMLYSKNLVSLITISIIIAIPFTYFIMNRWLQNYVYHIELKWWLFIPPVIATLIIAIITVSYKVLKTANANPANSLRYE